MRKYWPHVKAATLQIYNAEDCQTNMLLSKDWLEEMFMTRQEAENTPCSVLQPLCVAGGVLIH
eukprot:1848701-Amphidinium_carterae.1